MTAPYRAYRKWILGIAAVLLAVPLLVELGVRAVFYQLRGDAPVALVSAWDRVEDAVNRVLVRLRAGSPEFDEGEARALGLARWLARPEGAALRAELEAAYTRDLAALAADLERDGARMVLLYLPDGFRAEQLRAEAWGRDFFRALAERHGVPFVDATEAFAGYDYRDVTLMPEDGHLSRFGHRRLADALAPVLAGFAGHRSNLSFPGGERPERFGDGIPRPDRLVVSKPELPYRISINGQGLRGSRELTFPKQRQRILFLGDSLTLSAFVSDPQAFPALLEKRLQGVECLNAARHGYTVSDYLSLYRERARYAEPDVVVVQANGGDLRDLMAYHRNSHGRHGGTVLPTDAERRFIELIRARGGPPPRG